MTTELFKAFKTEVDRQARTITVITEKIVQENPQMSDIELAALTWKKVWDLEPVSDNDEFFQGQIELIKLIRERLKEQING